jgi:GntR family transcriptional regulator
VTLVFSVRPDSGEPIYLQLIRQIKHAVATGALAPGTQLPTVRQMAADLVINPNTVARAYRELEHEGMLEGVPGRGSFVTYGQSRLRDAERKRRLKTFVEQLWAEGRALGFSTEEIAELVVTELKRRAGSERRT